MKSGVRKILSGLMAVVMSAGALCMNVTAEYYPPIDNWRIKYRPGAPSTGDLQSGDICVIAIYGNGYKTHCSSISGSNNRYVKVSATGIREFIITTTGYSDIIPHPNIHRNSIEFTFLGHGSSECNASGRVGNVDSF